MKTERYTHIMKVNFIINKRRSFFYSLWTEQTFGSIITAWALFFGCFCLDRKHWRIRGLIDWSVTYFSVWSQFYSSMNIKNMTLEIIKKSIIILIIIGEIRTVTERIEKYVKKICIDWQVELLQKIYLLGMAIWIRKMMYILESEKVHGSEGCSLWTTIHALR